MLQPESVRLLIADISGYTEYLAGVEIDHAQDILADLISTVVTTLRPNFRLAKLEGDAAFCVAPADVDGSAILDTIEHCYFSFRRRRRDVRQATSCECNACSRIPTLNLKFVAHAGKVIRQQIADSEELLGSDVVVVHRMLKNEIAAQTGVTAYAAMSDGIVAEMAIDPSGLQMVRHAETYEHVGEIGMWIYDLERRWAEVETRERVYVSRDDAVFELRHEVAAPPQIVWEFLTTPGRRLSWQAPQGITALDQDLPAGGRRGVGMVNHCMHGPEAIIQEILDWRPFDYLTDRSMIPGDGISFVSTFDLEPTTEGTILSFRIGAPEDDSMREALVQLGAGIGQELNESLKLLTTEAAEVGLERSGGSTQPSLPVRRSTDNFLAGITPIQILD
jgi:hypothetical protein